MLIILNAESDCTKLVFAVSPTAMDTASVSTQGQQPQLQPKIHFICHKLIQACIRLQPWTLLFIHLTFVQQLPLVLHMFSNFGSFPNRGLYCPLLLQVPGLCVYLLTMTGPVMICAQPLHASPNLAMQSCLQYKCPSLSKYHDDNLLLHTVHLKTQETVERIRFQVQIYTCGKMFTAPTKMLNTHPPPLLSPSTFAYDYFLAEQ